MGYGGYSHEAHEAITKARAELPRQQVFKQTKCHPKMDPHGVKFREARDSEAHPNSVGIVFALDVTGSMGQIPDQLARRDLPSFMKALTDAGVPDPQLLFMAVGDATCDKAPIQVGQFESAAKEMDQWLTWSFLEGGGGALGTESYELGLYFAARHTLMDCWEKRKHRGYLFMTGDENPYPVVSRQQVGSLIADGLDEDLPLARLIDELQRTFEPFFLIPDPQRAKRCERVWRDALGDHVIVMEEPGDTCLVAASLVALCEGAAKDVDAVAKRLEENKTDKKRIGAVVRAITAFAASRGRDGAVPRVESGATPTKGESGHSR
jgi:hypothetical protein